jgi:hypothetical protein
MIGWTVRRLGAWRYELLMDLPHGGQHFMGMLRSQRAADRCGELIFDLWRITHGEALKTPV